MYVTFAYRLSDRYTEPAFDDPSQITEGILRNSLFCADIEIIVGDSDLSADWGWIPVLDFPAVLMYLLREIAESGRSELDFTENAETIRLSLDGARLTVGSSYTDAIATCNYAGWQIATSEFVRRVIAELRELNSIVGGSKALEQLDERTVALH